MIRLIVYPTRPGYFAAQLESNDLVIVIGSPSPLADGARRLLDMGYKPETPITMRHASKDYDSFEPQPLSYWAATSYKEGPRGPQRTKYVPMPSPDTFKPQED